MRVLRVCMLAIVLLGCRKHEHQQVVPELCTLCGYADQLEGSYYGKAEGYGVAGMTGNYADSLRVTVDHFYKSEGGYIDSTIMFLRLTSVYKSQPLTEHVRVIEMHSPENFTYFTPGQSGVKLFSFNPEELRILDKYYGPGAGLQVSVDYTGYRE